MGNFSGKYGIQATLVASSHPLVTECVRSCGCGVTGGNNVASASAQCVGGKQQSNEMGVAS